MVTTRTALAKTSLGRRLSQPKRWWSIMARAFANASSFVEAKTWSGCVRKNWGPGAICTRQPGPYWTASKLYPRYSIWFALAC